MASASPKATTLGKQAKTDLPASVFGEEFHESLVHETARADLAARRRGTASTLGRGEVSMTTAKAWKQKGTGRARAGALSVPHRRGGGVAFGPKPRSHTVKVNRKARRRALRSALSVHAARDSIAVFDAGGLRAPSTKKAAEALAQVGRQGRRRLVVARRRRGSGHEELSQPARGSPCCRRARSAVADVIGHASLVVSRGARRAGGACAEVAGRAAGRARGRRD